MQRLKKINDDAFERILNKAGKGTENPIPTWSLQEEAELDGKPFSFPRKDRSKSRTRYHASKRDKAKHYNKEKNTYIRDWRLYESGFNYSKGKSHNQDFLEYLTSLDMKSYNKDDLDKRNETINPTNKEEKQLTNCFLSVEFPNNNPHIAAEKLLEEFKDLSEKGILISTEIMESLRSHLSRRERKLAIDNERQTVAYSVYRYDFPDDFCLGTYPTREIAEENKIYLSATFPEYEHDYYILPVLTYTEEQIKEIKELGYIPVVGFVESSIKWNSHEFHAKRERK